MVPHRKTLLKVRAKLNIFVQYTQNLYLDVCTQIYQTYKFNKFYQMMAYKINQKINRWITRMTIKYFTKLLH